MKIDLTCPVELWQYAMPTDGEGECTFVMNNLSEKVVTSVQVTLHCYDHEDELLFRQTERIQGLKAGVGERFSLVILPSEWKAVEGVDLVIEKVWFDDATVWRKGNVPLTHFESNAIAPGRALDALRFVAGKDAVGYPQQQEEAWVCVCGRANAPESQRCCRCERRRDAVFASFNRENVARVIAAHEEKLAQTARKAREDNNLLQEKREKQSVAKRRRRKKAIRLAASAAVLLCAAAAAVVWGLPALRYYTAADLLRDGHYEQASAAFSQMGDYRDAAQQVMECEYRRAEAMLETDDEAALSEAQALFGTLADYRESAEKAREAAYRLAEMYLEDGRYEQATEAYHALGDYRDSADKRSEAVYRQAGAMAAAGSHLAARVLFVGLGDYRDAAAQADACTYAVAVEEMENGLYESALAELETLDADDEATALLIRQAHYALAQQDVEAERYESAGEHYWLAGDYLDAEAKANDCLYRLAQEVKLDGEYERAQALFERIPGYLDSEGQARSCVYERAMALLTAEDVSGAMELLETVADYDDAQAKLDECRYMLAQSALNEGHAEQAEELLASIVSHRGSESLLKKVRYELAEADWKAEKYGEALARYEQLGSYRSSVARARQCRYEMGKAALDSKAYEEAIACFEQLGSFKQSKTLLEEARYQRAMALREAGDMAGAKEALEAMKGVKRAKEALWELYEAEGRALFEAGDYEGAAEAYAHAETENAKEGVKASRYQLAVQLRESGDLPGAGAAFQQLGRYGDAEEQSEACYAAYYGEVAEQARLAMARQDYAGVMRLLDGFETSTLSKAYQDLPELYNEACYQLAEQLYREGKPFEAIPYYQAIGDYRGAAKEKLNRGVYLILGEWESVSGKRAVFRMDGTCELLGEELCYQVSNVRLMTGESPDALAVTHRLVSIDEKGMSLHDLADNVDYKFARVGEFSLPQMELPPAEDALATEPRAADEPDKAEENGAQGGAETPATDDEMLVTDDDQAPEA